MDVHVDFRAGSLGVGGPVQRARTTLAYSIMLLGLAGSIAAVPLAMWVILSRGLH